MHTFRSGLRRFSQYGLTMVLALVFGFLGSQAATVFGARGDGNIIHACVLSQNGQIRIVGANDACRKGEYHLDWNGGLGGTSGGITGLEVVWNSASQESNPTLTVWCPAGKKAIGGGVATLMPASTYVDRPVGTGITEPYFDNGVATGVSGTSTLPTGWTVRYTGDGQMLTVYAICANTAP